MRPGNIIGERHADADEAIAWDAGLGKELPDRALKEGANGQGLRKVNFSRCARAHLAHEIQYYQRDMVAVDVESNGEAAIGVDHELRRGLAAGAVQSTCTENQ